MWMRDGAPQGMLLQWTLPFNALSALLVNSFGENATLFFIAPLLILFALPFSIPALSALGNRNAWIWAPFALCTCTVVLSYGQPTRLNHHVVTALIALCSVSLALSLRRYPTLTRSFFTGAVMSLAAWQSMETVPALFAAWGLVMAAMAERPNNTISIFRGASLGLFFGFTLALSIDGPWPHFHPWTGHRISLFHASLGIGMIVGWSLLLPPRHPVRAGWMGLFNTLKTFIIPALATLSVAVISLIAIPETKHGPLFDSYFWSTIGELVSIKTAPEMVMVSLFVPILVTLIWLRITLRRPTPVRAMLLGIMLCAIAIGMVWIRMAAYAQIFSVIISVLLIASESQGIMKRHDVSPRRVGLFVFGFSALTALTVSWNSIHAQPQVRACLITPEQAQAIEKEVGSGIVMADVWLTPSLLHGTRSTRAVGGPYHGNPAGIEDVARFMMATSEAERRQVMLERGAQHALICVAPWYVSSRPWPALSIMDFFRGEEKQVPGLELIEIPPGNSTAGEGIRLFRLTTISE
jgi:hypothetical protein